MPELPPLTLVQCTSFLQLNNLVICNLCLSSTAFFTLNLLYLLLNRGR
jgi:hypothetical protein